MVVYLSSPGSQMHADHLRGMPVLLSYGASGPTRWLGRYIPSFGRLLIDSGAFSEMNSGVKIDLEAYAEWAQQFQWADAIASLDDIRGDWERGLENWRRFPWMFPTYHDSDPPEALDAILSHEPKWIGLGMVPPRTSEHWLTETLERIPAGVHVHGWALRGFSHLSRIDSFDSTDWFLASQRIQPSLWWLTPAECVEIVVKRYQRESRKMSRPDTEQGALNL